MVDASSKESVAVSNRNDDDPHHDRVVADLRLPVPSKHDNASSDDSSSTDSKAVSVDDENPPKEPLYPGDVIEYTPPVSVAGSVVERAVVYSTNSNLLESQFPIGLSNNHLLPSDTQIRRIGVHNVGTGAIGPLPLNTGKYRSGLWRPISNFEFTTLHLALPGVDTSSICAGLFQEARALREVLERGRESVEELFTSVVVQLEVDDNVDGDQEKEDGTSDGAGEKEDEKTDGAHVEDNFVPGFRVDKEDMILDVEGAGLAHHQGRKLSARKEVSLYCDEDQLRFILESHYSFPKTIHGETYDVDSDCDGDEGCEAARRSHTIREYVMPYKDQLMTGSMKRYSGAKMDSRNRVHGVDMDAIRKIMAEFFLQEAPPGIDADETIMLSNKLEFSRRHLSRLCLNSRIVATMDRPVCDKFWLTDELVNAYIGYCREQDYENTTFHNSTFWKLMVKVDSQADEYDIEKAWTYAKRFHPDHPKGEFKQAGLHFFPKCNDVHWYLIIVDFDQKIIFSVDSYGDVDHEKDAKVMLTFFRLALLKKRAATRHSSRR